MNFIELIFALLAKLVPMESDRRAQLAIDGNAWYQRVMLDPSKTPENKWLALAKEHCNAWYTQVGFAIAYIFLLRAAADYLEGSDQHDNPDEDRDR